MDNIHTMEQGSEEWFNIRIGRITASRFGDLLTQPRSKKDKEAGVLSQTTKSYILEKITEVMTGEHKELSGSALAWGKDTEQEAREFYELKYLTEVKEVGFVVKEDNKLIGGSPDGLVEEDGMIEIKCPYNSNNHIDYLFGGQIPRGYLAQIQGNLGITGRAWCDFVSYDPRIQNEEHKMFVKRIIRDEEFIARIDRAIDIALIRYRELLAHVGITFEDILNDKYQTQNKS